MGVEILSYRCPNPIQATQTLKKLLKKYTKNHNAVSHIAYFGITHISETGVYSQMEGHWGPKELVNKQAGWSQVTGLMSCSV